MKIECPVCFRNLDTLDANYLPGHSHTPFFGERCDGSDKSPEQAKADAKKAMAAWRKKVGKK